MTNLASPKLGRTALTGFLALAGTGVILVATSGTPAMALCKYGSPNCVDRHVGSPVLTGNNGVKIPDSSWEDPDCKYYGNCHSAARRGQTSGNSTRPDPRVTTYPGNLSGNPARVTGTVRDHRSPSRAPGVSSAPGGVVVRNTGPIIRDHRAPNIVVRDHRTPNVIVRDHRTPNVVVRDHRAPRVVVVRDHRGER